MENIHSMIANKLQARTDRYSCCQSGRKSLLYSERLQGRESNINHLIIFLHQEGNKHSTHGCKTITRFVLACYAMTDKGVFLSNLKTESCRS